MRNILIALATAAVCCSAAQAETTRFVCTNTQGAPDMLEVDFAKHTVLSYDKQDDGSIAPDQGETPMPASIDKTRIRWPDSLDGTKYTITRATGTLKKWFEGKPLYIKQCRAVSGGASGWE
jgi:hypothetical protein